MKIREILNKIQVELHAPKNQFNAFGKYNYRSCEDILEGLKPLLKETGAALAITDEIKQVGDRYYVVATAALVHPEHEGIISVSAYAREPEVRKGMDEAQVTGATSSYARKYALNGLFCIDDTKDADTKKAPDNKPAEAPYVQDEQLKKEVLGIAKIKFSDAEAFLKWRIENKFPEKVSSCTNIELASMLDMINC